MKKPVVLLCLLTPVVACCGAEGAAQVPASRPNVLFIAIDDQNDWMGCLGGHPQVQTPHFDRLAERGTLFTNAHIQSPLCNPSRSSLLTGLRPSTTGIYGLAPGIRDVERTKDHVTLPQTFTQAGYFTYTCGKIYHDGSIKPKDRAARVQRVGAGAGPGPAAAADRPSARAAASGDGLGRVSASGTKTRGTTRSPAPAIEALQQAPPDKPFFVACGFRLPHVPCYAPQKYFDLYPDATLQMPPVLENDRDDTPRFSWYLHWRLPEPRLKTLREYGEWRPLVRAYLASTSFMDAQLGRVLDALEATGRADNTMVVVWGDHGWHLGEKLISGKNSLWDRSTRVPLIFAGPGIAEDAQVRAARRVAGHLPDAAGTGRLPGSHRISKATASCRSCRTPTRRASGPPSRRTTTTTTASAPSAGATSATPTAPRNCTTCRPTRTSGRTWPATRSSPTSNATSRSGCPR